MKILLISLLLLCAQTIVQAHSHDATAEVRCVACSVSSDEALPAALREPLTPTRCPIEVGILPPEAGGLSFTPLPPPRAPPATC